MARRQLDEPNMSDRSLLLTVEDLINLAMGPTEKNTVNFKLVQTILYILARQMRLLKQTVELRIFGEEQTRETSPISGKSLSPTSKPRRGKGKSDGSDSDSPREKGRKSKGREEEDKDRSRKRSRRDDDDSDRRFKSKHASDTSIAISEAKHHKDKDKVLVVEKGAPPRHGDRDGIEVVTRSQFDLLIAKVNHLQKFTEPLPSPALPDNKKLRGELAKGSASLLDTMQAMQVTARVRAAEEAISRMGDLLTQLAASGALPEELADQMEGVRFIAPDFDAMTITSMKKGTPGPPRKSVAIDPMTSAEVGAGLGTKRVASRASTASRQASGMSRGSISSTTGMPGITKPDMDECVKIVKDDLLKNIQAMTSKANANAEQASMSAKAVAAKLDLAMNLDNRISTLHTLVADYAEQLSGFDVGLTTQLQSFRDQVNQMQSELQAGLLQLEQVNNNAETAALLELRERFDGLALELDQTMNQHRSLTGHEQQLAEDLRGLIECVEMLREQKSDRDEVWDALRDKADKSRLAGLLTIAEFMSTRMELENRLDLCHEKFQRQDGVWIKALKELGLITESKAEITQLLVARDAAEQALRKLKEMQDKLALKLGEPKAAMITRLLAKDALCGACLVPALMEPRDRSQGAPPPLPAMLPRAGLSRELCLSDWHLPEPPDDRQHTCHRWAGGSHTLLSQVTRAPAPPASPPPSPVRHYTDYGDDGRLYMLEEPLQPCVECNQYAEKETDTAYPAEQGAGDQGEHPAE